MDDHLFDLLFSNVESTDEGEKEEDEEDKPLLDTTEAPEITSSTTEVTEIKPVAYDNANIILNALEQDRVPLSLVNNTSTDQITYQMFYLSQLIDSLKSGQTTERHSQQTKYGEVTPVVYSVRPQKPPHYANPSQSNIFDYKTSYPLDYDANLLPNQLNKITAQLIRDPPNSQKQRVDLKLAQSNIEYSVNNFTDFNNTNNLALMLFQKYLIKDEFMNKGEYVKKTPINLTVTKKSEVTQSHNPFNKSSNNHQLVQKNHISSIPYATNGFYAKSCPNNVRLPDMEDCTRYFLCNSDLLLSYTCPPNTAFNKLKEICDIAEYKRCIKNIDGFAKKGVNKNVLKAKEHKRLS